MIVNFVNVNSTDPLLIADENTAKAMLESTFFNNITLTFNVGLGIFPPDRSAVGGSGSGGPNPATEVEGTYGELRTALLNSGQPTFFTATNLPDARNVNGVSNFWAQLQPGEGFRA
jgi:hypothetical protein